MSARRVLNDPVLREREAVSGSIGARYASGGTGRRVGDDIGSAGS